MSADESAQVCAAYDEALLLDLFSGTVTANELVQRTTAPAVCNHAFTDFQADLDAFDALITSSEQEESLLLHIAAASDNGHLEADSSIGGFALDDESSNTASTANGAADAAPTAAKKLKCAPGGNVARKRRREEIYALHDSAVKLEEELRRLRAIKMYESSVPTTMNSSSREGRRRDRDSLLPDQKAPWQWPPLVAVPRQRNPSVAQKFERALVKQRFPVITEVFLKKIPPAAKSVGVFQDTQVPPTVALSHTAHDLLMFETLARNVEMMRHDFERVFEAAGLTRCRSDMAKTRIATDDDADDNDVPIKFKSSRLMPFSVHAINETLLKSSQNSVGKRPGAAFEKTGQSVAYKKQLQAGDMSVSVRGVSRRYVENDHIMVVWESLSEWPSDGAAGGGDTLVFRQKAWARVQTYPLVTKKQPRKSAPSTSSPLSLLQSFIHITPTAQEGGIAKRNDAWRQQQSKREVILTDVVLPFYEKAFAARIQILENTLLEDSLKPKLEMAA